MLSLFNLFLLLILIFSLIYFTSYIYTRKFNNSYDKEQYYNNSIELLRIKKKLYKKDFDDFIDKKIVCLHVKNFYPKKLCNKIIEKINKINLNESKWKFDENTNSDVFIFQKPFSYVLEDMITPDEYFNQDKSIINYLYKDIINPVDYFCKIINHKKIKQNTDYIITNKFPKYKHYTNKFLDSVIRIYKPNSYNKKGLKHIDYDDTGYYKNCDTFSMNIYLKSCKDGGELEIWKNFLTSIKIKPKNGDLILLNTSYYHAVNQPKDTTRISSQSFLLYDSKNIMIRT